SSRPAASAVWLEGVSCSCCMSAPVLNPESGSPTRATAVPARSTRKATAQQTGRIGITCPQLATTAPKGDLSTGLWIGELSIVNLDGPNDSVGLGHISELRCMSGG